jgi:hypothetical protein
MPWQMKKAIVVDVANEKVVFVDVANKKVYFG